MIGLRSVLTLGSQKLPENLPSLSLVLGGAASGKSFYGEQMVKASGLSRVYLATAQTFDDEMRHKVKAHKDMRGPDWETIEEPIDIYPALTRQPSEKVVLLDCATMWLSNVLLADRDLDSETEQLLGALHECVCPVVVISNEVGQGIVPENALARGFRNAQGRLNQQLAAQADSVIGIMAGLPVVLKPSNA